MIFFFYGTLIEHDVKPCDLHHETVNKFGFITGGLIPYVVKPEDMRMHLSGFGLANISGVVKHVNDSDVHIYDRYEGEGLHYDRIVTDVKDTKSGEIIQCNIYVATSSTVSMISKSVIDISSYGNFIYAVRGNINRVV